MRKRVLVAVANGVEEIETLGTVDALRRAGAEVVIASVDHLEIEGACQIHFLADCLFSEISDSEFDLIVLPGGMPGAEVLSEYQPLIQLLKAQKSSGKLYAAICASPVVVLQKNGLLEDIQATSHPSLWDQLHIMDAAESRVVVDKNCVTSQGPGTTLEFAMKLIELLFGVEKAKIVGDGMVVR